MVVSLTDISKTYPMDKTALAVLGGINIDIFNTPVQRSM